MPIFPQSSGGGGSGIGGAGVISEPQFWAGGAGYSYWISNPNADLTAVASASNPAGLGGWGWTFVSVSVTGGGTGDFGSLADIDPVHYQLTTANDAMTSPVIFGGYEGLAAAAKFLGAMPTKFVLEFFASFPVNNTNQNTTAIGLFSGANAAANSAGAVYSDGSNFRMRNTTNIAAAGPAVDTAWHLFRIEIGAANTEWFMDDVSLGVITTEPDVFPLPFKAIAQANDILAAWANGRYEL